MDERMNGESEWQMLNESGVGLQKTANYGSGV